MDRTTTNECLTVRGYRINVCVFSKPLLHQWTVNVVVVDPTLITGIIRRVDVDALDAVFVAGE